MNKNWDGGGGRGVLGYLIPLRSVDFSAPLMKLSKIHFQKKLHKRGCAPQEAGPASSAASLFIPSPLSTIMRTK